MATHSSRKFLPRESCAQRSLVGCCPWGRTELDTTEATSHACMHWRRKWQPAPVFVPGESQDRGTWWAAIYRVAQSQTRLKRLSSSSSREWLSFAQDSLGRLHWGVVLKNEQNINRKWGKGDFGKRNKFRVLHVGCEIFTDEKIGLGSLDRFGL